MAPPVFKDLKIILLEIVYQLTRPIGDYRAHLNQIGIDTNNIILIRFWDDCWPVIPGTRQASNRPASALEMILPEVIPGILDRGIAEVKVQSTQLCS